MREVDTSFDPARNGFAFTNRFPGGAVVAELISQGRLSDLIGLRVPRAFGPISDLAAGEEFWGNFGLCGGMSWGAIDRFRRNEEPGPDHTAPGVGEDLFRELVARQADSLRGRQTLERCVLWQALPDRSPWWMIWSKGVGRVTTDQEWPKLRSSLDAGNVAGLVLVRAGGIVNPSVNHQVVATGYHLDDRGTVEVRLYDPNHPGERPKFSFDPALRSVGPRQSTGEPIRGFFVSSPE